MGHVHGKNGQVKVGENVCPVENWSYEETAPVDDTTLQGATGDDHEVGITGWSGELTLVLNKTNAAHMAIQAAVKVGTPLNVELYDGGIGSGATYRSGVCSVISMGRNVPKDATIRATVSVKGKGALADAVVGDS
jgi:hypothetical protein